MTFKRLNNITGWLAGIIATVVYFLTLEPTVSWWDCGEYISTAYKLQVGHPPGAPLFQMIGRFFTLFAGGDVTKVAMIDSLRHYQMLRVMRTSALEYNFQLDSLWQADKMRGNFALDSMLADIPLESRIEAIRNAAGNIPLMVDQIENCVREDYHYVDPLRKNMPMAIKACGFAFVFLHVL